MCVCVCLDTAVVCSKKGSLYLIQLRTGQSQLLHTLAGETFSSPVIASNDNLSCTPVLTDGSHLVVVGCRDNYVYCFRLVDDADASSDQVKC